MYDNKTNEQLVELLEERDQKIEEVEQSLTEEQESLVSAYNDLSRLHEIDDFDESAFAEKAFYAGFTEGSRTLDALKPWLNYKIMENIS